MKALKWNYADHLYYSCELPEGCRLFDNDMNSMVSCCQCGKQKKYGKTYTSKEIHTEMGLGYPVCEACYQLEIERYKK